MCIFPKRADRSQKPYPNLAWLASLRAVTAPSLLGPLCQHVGSLRGTLSPEVGAPARTTGWTLGAASWTDLKPSRGPHSAGPEKLESALRARVEPVCAAASPQRSTGSSEPSKGDGA